jgi:hypothetical protein
VRTGWPDADFKNIEETGFHISGEADYRLQFQPIAWACPRRMLAAKMGQVPADSSAPLSV